MQVIIFNRDNLTSYKDFYTQVYEELNGKGFIDWEDYPNLNYNANMLDEFLWYNHDKNIKFVFVGFDLKKIKQKTTYDDYEWKIIFEVLQDLVKQHPNNTIEFEPMEK